MSFQTFIDIKRDIYFLQIMILLFYEFIFLYTRIDFYFLTTLPHLSNTKREKLQVSYLPRCNLARKRWNGRKKLYNMVIYISLMELFSSSTFSPTSLRNRFLLHHFRLYISMMILHSKSQIQLSTISFLPKWKRMINKFKANVKVLDSASCVFESVSLKFESNTVQWQIFYIFLLRYVYISKHRFWYIIKVKKYLNLFEQKTFTKN